MTLTQADQEKIWVEQTMNGDRDAFAALVDAYKNPVYNLCYRMLGSPTEAEDAAQEVFVKMYRRLPTYDPNRKLASWVLSIASHHCIDMIRRRHLQTTDIEDMPEWKPLVSDKPQPDKQVLQNEQEERIQALVNQLEPQYRVPLIMHYWNDLPYQEICDATGLSLSAVKSRLHRARLKLAELLRTQAPDLIPAMSAMGEAERGNVGA